MSNSFAGLVAHLRKLEESFTNDVDMELHLIAKSGDEEELIDAIEGLKGDELQLALEDMMADLADYLASKGMNDVINDQDKMIEMLMDKIVDEYRFTGDSDDGQPSSYDEYQDLDGGDDYDHGQYDEVVDNSDEQIAERIVGLKEKLAQFKETYLKEFGADNNQQQQQGTQAGQTGQMDPEEMKKQNMIKANLNQLKAAGVDIDPSKNADDPDNAQEIGAKVQAAMADPAMANQVKSVLQRIKV